jgi:hypothetical protein
MDKPSTPWSLIGKQTREAIGANQRELKLPVDGEPSTAFLKELQRVADAS